MINKIDLQSVISKYYLKQNERVIWEIEDNTLSVQFQTPQHDVIGIVTYEDFQIDNIRLPIYSTGKLQNLISVCSGDLMLEIEKHNETPTKLHISDYHYNVSYALSNELVIPKVGSVNMPGWDVVIQLQQEDISNLVKAKNALSDIDNMIITTEEDADGELICRIVFGDEMGHNNKISYQLRGDISMVGIEHPFSANRIRDILHANKDSEEGTLRLSNDGLIQLSFKNNNNISSIYNIIRKEDTNF